MKVPCLIFYALLLSLSSPFVRAMNCHGLEKLAPDGVYIKAQRHAADGGSLQAFCLVLGHMSDRVGQDGRPYSIQFELRLPDHWQGRFAYQFNDGTDGIVRPALGNITGQTNRQFAINNGFAVVSSNGGHEALPVSQAGLMGASLFGYDPEARRDYGYDAVRQLYPVARTLIQSYYGSPIQYSYGIGSSNGGRMAMVSASRYPRMFDGLVLGYPAINFPKAALQFPWDVQTLHKVNPNITQAISEREMALFTQKLLQQCDALDGLKDGLIFASETCQKRFQPALLACESEFDRYCLAPEKVAAIIRMQQGPKNTKGQALYISWVYDYGMRSKDWRRWRLQSTVNSWAFRPMNAVLGAASLANVFMTPPVKVTATPHGLESFLLHFNFDKDAPKIFATQGIYTESSMGFMSSPDVASPNLDAFKYNGGKMIIFHGNSDPVFSVKDTMRWYDYLNFNQTGKASEFVRFYRVPGMGHGQGGPSVDAFDMLAPLVNWVEKKRAPSVVMASTRVNNDEVKTGLLGQQRPLCPYPTTTFYRGGNVNSASSFICAKEP